MKLKLIALAVMVAAAGSAQARIADSNDYVIPANGGSSAGGDMFASLASETESATFTVDLGLRLSQFTAAVAPTQLGVKLVWDFDANTFADLSTTSTGLASQLQTLNYGSVYSNFATPNVIGAADLKFAVQAGDGHPTFAPPAGSNLFLSTSANEDISARNLQVFNMDFVDGYVTSSNNDTTNNTHGTAFNTAGANSYQDGDAFNSNFQNGVGDQWVGAVNFVSTGPASAGLNFFSLTNSSANAAHAATITKYAGVWNFDATTAQLSYVSAVPEADTYAMMLAGLGLVGFMARRRRAV